MFERFFEGFESFGMRGGNALFRGVGCRRSGSPGLASA